MAAKLLSRPAARKQAAGGAEGGLLAVGACERVLRAVFAELILGLAGTADPRIQSLPPLEGTGAAAAAGSDPPTARRQSISAGGDDDAAPDAADASGHDAPTSPRGGDGGDELSRLSRALVRGRGAGRLWAGPRALYRAQSSRGATSGDAAPGNADAAEGAAAGGDGAEGAVWRWLSNQHRQRPLPETLVEFMYSIFLQKVRQGGRWAVLYARRPTHSIKPPLPS